MKEPIVVQKKWCIELTNKEFSKLRRLDNNYNDPERPYEILCKINYITDIEYKYDYDENSGTYIWFTTNIIDGKEPVDTFYKTLKQLLK